MSQSVVNLGTLNKNSTYRFKPALKKDGAVWDLSDGSPTVTLTFELPDRSTQETVAMTALTDGSDGVFYFDTPTTDSDGRLDTVGYWTATVRVVVGSVDVRYPQEIGFRVKDQP